MSEGEIAMKAGRRRKEKIPSFSVIITIIRSLVEGRSDLTALKSRMDSGDGIWGRGCGIWGLLGRGEDRGRISQVILRAAL